MTDTHRPANTRRSGCPINLAVEVFGDKWSLIVLRDMMFGNRRHFRALLTLSDEGIASNVLADRLKSLLKNGLISKVDDPSHKQKAIYSLTEMAIALVPVFAHIGGWGVRFLPASDALSIRAQLLEAGGPSMWAQFMDELRVTHLGLVLETPRPSVAETLQAAYLERLAAKRVIHET